MQYDILNLLYKEHEKLKQFGWSVRGKSSEEVLVVYRGKVCGCLEVSLNNVECV